MELLLSKEEEKLRDMKTKMERLVQDPEFEHADIVRHSIQTINEMLEMVNSFTKGE